MVFRGKDDLRVLLTAVYGGMTGLRWREEFGDARHRVVIGDGHVGPLRMSDAMVFDPADDGRIHRIRPSPSALARRDAVRAHPGPEGRTAARCSAASRRGLTRSITAARSVSHVSRCLTSRAG